MDDKIFSRKRFIIPKFRKKRHKGLGNYVNYSAFKGDGSYNLNNNVTRKLIKTSTVIIIAVCIANKIIAAVEPTIDVLCINMAKGIATEISNEQSTIVMKNYKYEDLSNIVRDEQGNIQMIKMDVVLVNQITSDIALKIQENINSYERSNFYIRLGTFTGTKIFSGRGPRVEIKMSTTGNVNTELVSQFFASGVNQTIHRIYLKVDCSISVLTPFDNIEESITNQILLAEAVIVGEVPDTYYNLNGVTSDDLMEVME